MGDRQEPGIGGGSGGGSSSAGKRGAGPVKLRAGVKGGHAEVASRMASRWDGDGEGEGEAPAPDGIPGQGRMTHPLLKAGLTGERVIPELMSTTNGMLLEHMARYHFTVPYARGRMADIACGAGYGPFFLAKAAKGVVDSVVAVDLDPTTVSYAKSRYYHQKITYVEADVLKPGFVGDVLDAGTFDCVVSFETLEHLPAESNFVALLHSLLKPGGTLVCSAPFGKGIHAEHGGSGHFHEFEPTEEEFEGLFTDLFGNVEIYRQRGVCIEGAPRENVRYMFGIAVCTKE